MADEVEATGISRVNSKAQKTNLDSNGRIQKKIIIKKHKNISLSHPRNPNKKWCIGVDNSIRSQHTQICRNFNCAHFFGLPTPSDEKQGNPRNDVLFMHGHPCRPRLYYMSLHLLQKMSWDVSCFNGSMWSLPKANNHAWRFFHKWDESSIHACFIRNRFIKIVTSNRL